jgi:hypothetical protein
MDSGLFRMLLARLDHESWGRGLPEEGFFTPDTFWMTGGGGGINSGPMRCLLDLEDFCRGFWSRFRESVSESISGQKRLNTYVKIHTKLKMDKCVFLSH